MGHDESEKATAAEKLRLLKSPLINDSSSESLPPTHATVPDLQLFGDRFGPDHDCPQFQKHEDASLLELFFDLFFAANYTVFSETQGINSHDRFKAYVGYFSVLWITWLLVGLYDVRFVTDSIFERATRGVQLGVMVGFAVVAPHFKPNEQNVQTMRTMSIILAISRFCLTVEYGSILWHIRAYKKQRIPMLTQMGLNLIAASIYLGMTFRFREEKNSRVFVIWYVLAGIEVFATLVIANIWPVLSFTGTHLMKRMGLLTVIILGDGIIVVAQNVVTIVESPNAWNSRTIGIVTAATTTIYFVFLIYFDWMKTPYLPAVRQQLWTCLHYPFHLALVLFMQGFTQFIIWSKIVDVMNHISFKSVLNNVDDVARATSDEIYNNFQNITTAFFETYPPKYYLTWQSVDSALYNLTTVPDKFWPQLAKYIESEDDKDAPDMDELTTVWNAIYSISSSMENALLETFGIDLVEEVLEEDKNTTFAQSSSIETKVNEQTWERFDLVFANAYIAAGITLILMTVLTIIARTTPWKKWSIIRTILFILLGLGMSLVSVLHFSPGKASKFQDSPWLLPTICIVWVVVLFLTHARNPPPLLFSNRKSKASYDPVAIPLHESSTEYKGVPNPQIAEQHRQTSYYGHPAYGA